MGRSPATRPTVPSIVWVALYIVSLNSGCAPGSIQRGLYYYGHEVNVICPCGTTTCYWVRAEPGVLNPMKDFVLRQTSKPYQPVFLSYRGRLLDERPVGFGASYDGLLRVDEVLSLNAVLPPDCPAP